MGKFRNNYRPNHNSHYNSRGAAQEPAITATSPYRFVPMGDKIFYPSDFGEVSDDKISFDKPFKDAHSGVLELEIEALSDIFVGDIKPENDKEAQGFFKLGENYAIAGSSVRGVISTIAEILSYAKFKTQDAKIAYRDLYNEDYMNAAVRGNATYMGFLYKHNSQILIDNRGKIEQNSGSQKGRIFYRDNENGIDITKLLGGDIARQLKQKKDAVDKYNLIGDLEKLRTKSGTIVFTGSTNPEKKTREFLFPNESKGTLKVSKELFDDFKLAYGIDIKNASNVSKIWKEIYAKRFKKGEKVPVFFQLDEKGAVKHFGLSQLYKLPYPRTPKQIAESQQRNFDKNKLDMVQRIFGFVNTAPKQERDSSQNAPKQGAGKSLNALKSRISFSHFIADNAVPCGETALILSSPRPSFYPFYLNKRLESPANAAFKTYNDRDARLEGYKFYPPKSVNLKLPQEMDAHNDPKIKNNDNIKSRIIPLKKGATFRGRFRYFNLTKAELGLLLLALSVLNDEGCVYKIGGAKPYGYGDCHIKISGLDPALKDSCIAAFKDSLQKDGFDAQSRIVALRKVSKQGAFSDDKLEYMRLKDFADIKRENQNKYKPKNNQRGGGGFHNNRGGGFGGGSRNNYGGSYSDNSSFGGIGDRIKKK